MRQHNSRDNRSKPNAHRKGRIVLAVMAVVIAALLYRPLYIEALNAAVRSNDISRVKAILFLPGDPNYHYLIPDTYGNPSPLTEACRYHNIEMMGLLIEHGVEANASPGNWQPLEMFLGSACEDWYETLFEGTKLLVENGSDINVCAYNFDRPVAGLLRKVYIDRVAEKDVAYANGEVLRTLVYLVENGAEVKLDVPAQRYLPDVAQNENYGVLEYLFDECGLDVDEPAVGGETALMRASKLGMAGMAEFLIGYGADASIRDDEGKTALDYAHENGHEDVVRMLEGA